MNKPGKDESRIELPRRQAIRRVAIGLPVILATVHGRKVWAQTPGSASASGIPSPTQ